MIGYGGSATALLGYEVGGSRHRSVCRRAVVSVMVAAMMRFASFEGFSYNSVSPTVSCPRISLQLLTTFLY